MANLTFDQLCIIALCTVFAFVINIFLYDCKPKEMKKAFSILFPALVTISFFSVIIIINLISWKLI